MPNLEYTVYSKAGYKLQNMHILKDLLYLLLTLGCSYNYMPFK